jgi:hypothetical protein
MAFNISNLICIYSSFLPSTLNVGYNINQIGYNLILCRLRLYTAFALNCLCPSYLIFASIDRVFITSRNALTRKRSTRRRAYILIISEALFWMLFSSHVTIFATILPLGLNSFYCYVQQGFYSTIIAYASLIKATVAPA